MSQNIASTNGAGWIQTKPTVASGTDIVYFIVIFEHFGIKCGFQTYRHNVNDKNLLFHVQNQHKSQHMIKIILCTNRFVIEMACSLLSIYHNTITHKGRMIIPVSYDGCATEKIHCPASQKIRRLWTKKVKLVNISYIKNKIFDEV